MKDLMLLFIGLIGSLVAICWLGISIYLIIIGKADKTGMNVKRKLGLCLLIVPLILVVFAVLYVFFPSSEALNNMYLLSFFIFFTFFVLGIVYSIKNHIKIALVPLILILLMMVLFFLLTLAWGKSYG
jgi:hypothetical protein